jgi:hypothetical protein
MNATITLTGIQVTASNLPLPDASTWFDWYYERNLDFAASANTECSAIVTTSEAESISGTGDAFLDLIGNELNSAIAEIDALGDSNQALSGQELALELGEVSATAVTPVDASVQITGVALVSAVGNVSANAISAEILQLSGNPRRYSAAQFKNNVVKIQGIDAKITTGRVSALGVISISGTAILQNVGLYSEVQTVSAEGILSISEDELILLLAA